MSQSADDAVTSYSTNEYQASLSFPSGAVVINGTSRTCTLYSFLTKRSVTIFFPKEGARKFLINLNVGDLERWKFQASGVA